PEDMLDRVDFVGTKCRRMSVDLPGVAEAEIAVKRSRFDAMLLDRARKLGVAVFESATVTALSSPDPRTEYWRISTAKQAIEARILVAADGRNSSVARLCGLLPRPARERVALQTHLPLPPDFGD